MRVPSSRTPCAPGTLSWAGATSGSGRAVSTHRVSSVSPASARCVLTARPEPEVAPAHDKVPGAHGVRELGTRILHHVFGQLRHVGAQVEEPPGRDVVGEILRGN